MARPRKEGLEYFAHDCDASGDDKIEVLEAVYGLEGYAVYFKLLERIYLNKGKIFLSDPEEVKRYADKFRVFDAKKFEKMIDFMALKKLFNEKLWKDAKCLTSRGIVKRVQFVQNKRVKERNRKKKDVSGEFSDGFPSKNSARPLIVLKQSKEKQSKVKDTKENPPETQHPIKFLESEKIDELMQQNLGKIATVEMIESTLLQIPEAMWWKVDNFLKRTYSGGGDGFQKATINIKRKCPSAQEASKFINQLASQIGTENT